MALVSAGLWAVHPVNTEAVLYASGRADLLSAFFFLLCMVAYASLVRDRDAPVLSLRFLGALVLALSTTVLSLYSKETGVTAMLFCAAWDVFMHVGCTVPELFMALSSLVTRRGSKDDGRRREVLHAMGRGAILGLATVAIGLARLAQNGACLCARVRVCWCQCAEPHTSPKRRTRRFSCDVPQLRV